MCSQAYNFLIKVKQTLVEENERDVETETNAIKLFLFFFVCLLHKLASQSQRKLCKIYLIEFQGQHYHIHW